MMSITHVLVCLLVTCVMSSPRRYNVEFFSHLGGDLFSGSNTPPPLAIGDESTLSPLEESSSTTLLPADFPTFSPDASKSRPAPKPREQSSGAPSKGQFSLMDINTWDSIPAAFFQPAAPATDGSDKKSLAGNQGNNPLTYSEAGAEPSLSWDYSTHISSNVDLGGGGTQDVFLPLADHSPGSTNAEDPMMQSDWSVPPVSKDTAKYREEPTRKPQVQRFSDGESMARAILSGKMKKWEWTYSTTLGAGMSSSGNDRYDSSLTCCQRLPYICGVDGMCVIGLDECKDFCTCAANPHMPHCMKVIPRIKRTMAALEKKILAKIAKEMNTTTAAPTRAPVTIPSGWNYATALPREEPRMVEAQIPKRTAMKPLTARTGSLPTRKPTSTVFLPSLIPQNMRYPLAQSLSIPNLRNTELQFENPNSFNRIFSDPKRTSLMGETSKAATGTAATGTAATGTAATGTAATGTVATGTAATGTAATGTAATGTAATGTAATGTATTWTAATGTTATGTAATGTAATGTAATGTSATGTAATGTAATGTAATGTAATGTAATGIIKKVVPLSPTPAPSSTKPSINVSGASTKAGATDSASFRNGLNPISPNSPTMLSKSPNVHKQTAGSAMKPGSKQTKQSHNVDKSTTVPARTTLLPPISPSQSRGYTNVNFRHNFEQAAVKPKTAPTTHSSSDTNVAKDEAAISNKGHLNKQNEGAAGESAGGTDARSNMKTNHDKSNGETSNHKADNSRSDSINDNSTNIRKDTTHNATYKDTSGINKDRVGTSRDTASTRKDNTGLNKDTTDASKDTSSTNKDTTSINKDTSNVRKDTSGINKDIANANNDTIGTKKDTTGVNKDTAGINKDTVGTNKDDTVVNKDTAVVNYDRAGNAVSNKTSDKVSNDTLTQYKEMTANGKDATSESNGATGVRNNNTDRNKDTTVDDGSGKLISNPVMHGGSSMLPTATTDTRHGSLNSGITDLTTSTISTTTFPSVVVSIPTSKKRLSSPLSYLRAVPEILNAPGRSRHYFIRTYGKRLTTSNRGDNLNPLNKLQESVARVPEVSSGNTQKPNSSDINNSDNLSHKGGSNHNLSDISTSSSINRSLDNRNTFARSNDTRLEGVTSKDTKGLDGMRELNSGEGIVTEGTTTRADNTASEANTRTDNTATEATTGTDNTATEATTRTDNTATEANTRTENTASKANTRTDNTATEVTTGTDNTATEATTRTHNTATEANTRTDNTATEANTRTDNTATETTTGTDDVGTGFYAMLMPVINTAANNKDGKDASIDDTTFLDADHKNVTHKSKDTTEQGSPATNSKNGIHNDTLDKDTTSQNVSSKDDTRQSASEDKSLNTNNRNTIRLNNGQDTVGVETPLNDTTDKASTGRVTADTNTTIKQINESHTTESPTSDLAKNPTSSSTDIYDPTLHDSTDYDLRNKGATVSKYTVALNIQISSSPNSAAMLLTTQSPNDDIESGSPTDNPEKSINETYTDNNLRVTKVTDKTNSDTETLIKASTQDSRNLDGNSVNALTDFETEERTKPFYSDGLDSCLKDCSNKGGVCVVGDDLKARCVVVTQACDHILCINGYCVTSEGLSTCECHRGWVGESCENRCSADCGERSFCQAVGENLNNSCSCRWNYTGQQCENPRDIVKTVFDLVVPVDNFHTWKVAIVSAVSAVLVALACVLSPYYLWKKQWLPIRKLIFFFLPFEQDDDKEYDAFVSYKTTPRDERFVLQHLYPKLEQELDFRLCLHFRDFTPGDSMTSNTIRAIQSSRRTILVLSPSYVSDWNSAENQKIHQELLKVKNKVIPIVLEDVSGTPGVDDSFKTLTDTSNKFQWPGEEKSSTSGEINTFWKLVELSMPKRKYGFSSSVIYPNEFCVSSGPKTCFNSVVSSLTVDDIRSSSVVRGGSSTTDSGNSSEATLPYESPKRSSIGKLRFPEMPWPRLEASMTPPLDSRSTSSRSDDTGIDVSTRSGSVSSDFTIAPQRQPMNHPGLMPVDSESQYSSNVPNIKPAKVFHR